MSTKPVGRPPIKHPRKPFGVPLNEKEKELIKEYADNEGMPLAVFIRNSALDKVKSIK